MNETKTLTISEFLRERLADEERDARSRRARVHAMTCDGFPSLETDSGFAEATDGVDNCTCGGAEYALEDIMSKRAIVDLHEPIENIHGRGECTACGIAGEFPVRWPCPTLRLLAAPYRHHPDYRGEWA